jgi:hypothetical protein
VHDSTQSLEDFDHLVFAENVVDVPTARSALAPVSVVNKAGVPLEQKA